MKYKAMITLGIALILVGYGLMKSGGREVHVTCERTESAFLPVCHLREYFLGMFPNGGTETVAEITTLSRRGKQQQEFFLVQRLPNRKLAPVELNQLNVSKRSPDDPMMANIRSLAAFFAQPNDSKVEVRLTNDAGSVPVGILLLISGAIVILYYRIRQERRKPKQTYRHLGE